MESTITVDSNSAENFIYDFLVTKCPQGVVRRERLDVGDIRIVTEHCTVVIERKHVPDLVSSIRDGRYKVRVQCVLAAVDARARTETQHRAGAKEPPARRRRAGSNRQDACALDR